MQDKTPEGDYLWDRSGKADPVVARLEEALRPLRHKPQTFSYPAESSRVWTRRWSIAAAAAIVIGIAAGYGTVRTMARPWEVRALEGTARIGGVQAQTSSQRKLTEGKWLETGNGSAARLNVGHIGRADIGPNSLLGLVRAKGTEHRLSLLRGTLRAQIWAPPRFFLVETPGALAVDLGCVYSLTIEPDGSGLLIVESGQVELIEGMRRVIVFAGNAATMQRGKGPGLPFPVTATPLFHAALAAYQLNPQPPAMLDTLLARADSTSTITLWHLLAWVGSGQREQVYVRLAGLSPPPPDVTLAAVMRLERRALDKWKNAMEPSWTHETVPVWKRYWRRFWTYLLIAG